MLLHDAIRAGNLPALRRALTSGAPVDARDALGRAAIHLAAEKGYADMLRALLAARARFDLTDKAGHTPLHAAIPHWNEAGALALIQAGADVRARDALGRTALHLAVNPVKPACIKALLHRQADPAAADLRSATPISMAAAHGQTIALRLLLNAGPCSAKAKDAALALAWAGRHQDCVILLLEAGATPAADSTGVPFPHQVARFGGTTILAALHARGFDLNAPDPQGDSPLLHASKSGNGDTVGFLLSLNAPASQKNREGASPLRLAVRGNDLRSVTTLLRAGADARELDAEGASLIHEWAATTSATVPNLALLKALLAAGAPLDAPTYRVRVPLSPELEGKGARPKLSGGVTPLRIAIDRSAFPVIAALLEAGADLPAAMPSADGAPSPLHIAVEAENEAWLQKFLETGANPRVRDAHGLTPLDHVIRKRLGRDTWDGIYSASLRDMTWHLCKHGADPLIRDAEGLPLFDIRKVIQAPYPWLEKTPFAHEFFNQPNSLRLLQALLQAGFSPKTRLYAETNAGLILSANPTKLPYEDINLEEFLEIVERDEAWWTRALALPYVAKHTELILRNPNLPENTRALLALSLA